MSEQAYVESLFKEHFSSFRNTNIALYGLSGQTEMILELFPEYRILALLDGFKEDGTAYGKPIIPLSKLIESQISVIIIVARAASVKIIYRRISGFCKQHGIRVYDLSGHDLSEENISFSPVFESFITEADMIEKINQYENISFDVFNTLLLRKTYYAQDVFDLVSRRCEKTGIDFAKERIRAEHELGQTNPTLEEIYDRVIKNTGISESVARKFLSTEIEVEESLLSARDAMVRLFEFAVTRGKRVSLISDMYLSKETISGVLKNSGISEYEELMVSCEYKTNKRQDLYRLYKKIINGNTYLHIGDDKEVDGVFAKRNGIDEILIYSPAETLENSTFRSLTERLDTIERRISIGLLAERVFNSPFCLVNSKGRPKIKDAYEMGYVFIAPLLTNYVLWLREQLRGKGYSKILFLSRDGYLIKQLYDEAISHMGSNELFPESIYFLTSRQACIAATAKTEEDVRYAANLAYNGTPEELLKKRFFIKEDEREPYEEGKYVTTESYILQHLDVIKRHGAELEENYQKYIYDLNIGSNEKIAIFDFVSTGTCQMCLEDILGYKLDGFYFMQLPERYDKKERLSITSYYDYDLMEDRESSLATNYFFLESIIKAAEPSVSYFNSSGDPVYAIEKRTEKELKSIKSIHRGIMDCFKTYLMILKGAEPKAEKMLADQILGLLQSRYSDVQIEELMEYSFIDEFCNRRIDVPPQ